MLYFCVERMRASKKETPKLLLKKQLQHKGFFGCWNPAADGHTQLSWGLFWRAVCSVFPSSSTHPTHKRVNCQSHPWEVAKQHQLCHQALVLPQDASGSADDSAVQQENAQKA